MSTMEAAPTVPRDQWGRYLLRPEHGGERRAYTRVTTVASALDDRRSLEAWLQRCVAVGLVERHDLYALIAAAHPDISDKSIDPWISQAVEAAKSSERANLGTALHRFCERVDKTADKEAELALIPEPYRTDVAAYLDATSGFRWMVVEEIAVLEELSIAGMPDRIGYTPEGELVVADLKTGRGSGAEGLLLYGWLAYGIQCALYAHASHIYDLADDSRLPMPHELSKSTAIIIHLPAGEGRCQLYDVDIERGWDDAQLALEVRGERASQGKIGTLRAQWSVAPSSAGARAVAHYTQEAASAAPEATERPDRANGNEVLAARASGLEPDESRLADQSALDALKEHYEALPIDQRSWITEIVQSARLHDIPPSRLHLRVLGSVKRFELLRGLVRLAETGNDTDEQVRQLIGVIDPALSMPIISLGAALAVLTTPEALAFSGLTDNLIDRANEKESDEDE